jgi:hypothetical protein
MRIRRRLLPYRRTLSCISLALVVFLFSASIRTELWEPIGHPRKVRGLALLVCLLSYIFILPTRTELRERHPVEPPHEKN